VTEATGRDRREAFERVALPHASALYRTARRVSRRPADAGDLVQETFLRAYRTFDNFQPGTNAKAWLFTIMYSIVANVWRRNARTPEEVPITDAEGRFEQALTGDASAIERELLSALDASSEVDQALKQLPEVFRDVVLLVDVEGLTYEEAAAALSCPVGTIRSRLARARKQLFVALHDYARRAGF
jgi:RNA polymerase sigma-70 factor (ECF subfamily)